MEIIPTVSPLGDGSPLGMVWGSGCEDVRMKALKGLFWAGQDWLEVPQGDAERLWVGVWASQCSYVRYVGNGWRFSSGRAS